MRSTLLLGLFVACLVPGAGAGQTPASGAELLAEMQKKYAADLLPKTLRVLPITVEQADAFAAGIKFFREAAKADLPKIQAVEAGKDDRRLRSDKQRLENWIGVEVPRKLDEALRETRQVIEGAVSNGTDYVKFGAEIDLADKDKVRNNFANPDNVDLREKAIRETAFLLDLLIRLEAQLGEKTGWPEKKKEFDAIAAKFHEKLAASASLIVPPKDIGDAELKKTAEAALKDPKHGAAAWKRLIVNSTKQNKSYSVYEVRDRVIIRVDYDYDHFQATTIEPEGKDLFLFHNTIAFYRSGATTTPLNQWVVRERFRGARIVPDNVDK